MRGHIAADWLRLRKRRSLVVIVLAVPVLVGFFFIAGYLSIWEPPPFDEQAFRAELIAGGYTIGLPPEEAEQLLAEAVEQNRQGHEEQLEYTAAQRATYAFPRSLITVLGSGTFAFFALILLAATTIGDEFSSGTIRTTLLASSNRRRLLLVRIGALVATAAFLFGALLLLGVLLPIVLNVNAARLPATLPPIDPAGLGVLLLGQGLTALAVVVFAAMATVVVRNGALTLVVVLVYVLVEGAILALLTRFESFQDGGEHAWTLSALPVRGLVALVDNASRVASAMPRYPGDAIVRDLGPSLVPLIALTAWAVLFGSLAFYRFSRMDIRE